MVSLVQGTSTALSCVGWQFRSVSKHFTFESSVVAPDFLLIAQIIVQLLCLHLCGYLLSDSMKGRINPFVSSDTTCISEYFVWLLGVFLATAETEGREKQVS